MRTELEQILKRYVSLANSGDAGHWDPETEPEVIAARVALAGPDTQADSIMQKYAFSDLFYECDGPPRAYFEIPLPLGAQTRDAGGPFYLRGTYESLLIYSDNEQSARNELRRFLTLAADLLPPLEDDANATDDERRVGLERRTRFLVWRRRPEWQRRFPKKNESGVLYSRFWIGGFSLTDIPLARNNAGQYIWHARSEMTDAGIV